MDLVLSPFWFSIGANQIVHKTKAIKVFIQQCKCVLRQIKHTHLVGRQWGWPYSQGHWCQLPEKWCPWGRLGFQVCSWLWSPRQKRDCLCVFFYVCVCVCMWAHLPFCFIPSRPWGRRRELSIAWRTGKWEGTSAPTAAGYSLGWSSEAESSQARRAATSEAHTNHLRTTHIHIHTSFPTGISTD